MRELKFRVWDNKDNVWLTEYVGIDNHGVIINDRDDMNDLSLHRNCTTEQFTGLLDRNGKEIFEGDILKLPDSLKELGFINGLVEYESGCMGCRINYDLQLIPFVDMSREELQNLEILGNVNENSELLK
jgi:uncharacterized phage protein (TIGR01671 family)